jgi:ABC-2 type transport system ATP-binding protein
MLRKIIINILEYTSNMISSNGDLKMSGSDQDAQLIVAKDILVRFGDKVAVNGIDVSVMRGEVYGFLGPNGAGKTTTIRVLTTLLHPTSGNIWIDGLKVPDDNKEIRKRIGMVQQQISLDKDISVRENIICHALLHKVPKDSIKRRLESISSALELTPFLDYTVINLSGGWQRKTAIACALMHDPKVLFLDEPTAGLDTQSRHMLWDMIRQLNRAGTTIFLTTHYIEEAENLCDRVAIINHGKIVTIGSPQELCNGIGRFAVEYDDNACLRKYRYFSDWTEAKEFAGGFKEEGVALLRKTSLEDVFLEITGRKVTADFVKVIRV